MLFYLAALCAAAGALATTPSTATPTAPTSPITTSIQEKAIRPTKSGQIGVNPVSPEFGPSQNYHAPVGTDTDLYTQDSGTVVWDSKIHQHSEYLSTIITTTSDGGKHSSGVSTVKVTTEAVPTKAPDAPPAGGTAVLIPEVNSNTLNDAAKTAINACSALKARKRQDFWSCISDHATNIANSKDIWQGLSEEDMQAIALEIAESAPIVLKNALQVLTTQALKNKFLLGLAAIAAGGTAVKWLIPPEGVAAAPSDLPKAGPTSTDTRTGCPSASRTLNADSVRIPQTSTCLVKTDFLKPVCTASDCKGPEKEDKPTCSTGDAKGCPCAYVGSAPVVGVYDKDFWDWQQSVLGSAVAHPAPTAKPNCTAASVMGFGGKNIASPATFCACPAGNDRVRNYATITSAKSSPCAFTEIPSSTISPSVSKNTEDKVTSCTTTTWTNAIVSPTGIQSACQCNDNSQYMIKTSTTGGKTSKYCDAPTPTSSSSKQPLPSSTKTGRCIAQFNELVPSGSPGSISDLIFSPCGQYGRNNPVPGGTPTSWTNIGVPIMQGTLDLQVSDPTSTDKANVQMRWWGKGDDKPSVFDTNGNSNNSRDSCKFGSGWSPAYHGYQRMVECTFDAVWLTDDDK